MKKKFLFLLLLPGLLFLTIFMVVPILLTIGSTFFD
ncbi:ABC transporter permease, partial [Paenibacillus sp. TAF58]